MLNLTDFEQDVANERVAHMLGVLKPHSEALSGLLSMYHNVFISIPTHLDTYDLEIRSEAIKDPISFIEGTLMAKCFEIAIAEQQTKTTYPDDKLFDKVKCDLEADIAKMAQLERGASSSRAH